MFSFLGKLYQIFKLWKSQSYDKIADIVLPLIFENKAVAPFLERNKIIIGFILQVIASGLELGKEQYGEQPFLVIALTVVGLLLQALGIAHRGSKERRGR